VPHLRVNKTQKLRDLIPKKGIPQKIKPEKVKFIRAQKLTFNLPAFTSKPPQLHHQKTTFCTPFFPKPPAKTRVHQPGKITANATVILTCLSPTDIIGRRRGSNLSVRPSIDYPFRPGFWLLHAQKRPGPG
jgi:hypothetical protein